MPNTAPTVWKISIFLIPPVEFLRHYAYNFRNPLLAIKAGFFDGLEKNFARCYSINSVVGAAANIFAGQKLGAALAHQNIAWFCSFAGI